MCGIIGYTGPKPALPLLLDGLSKLEYRGYDSSGVALLTSSQRLLSFKKAGKIRNLASALQRSSPLPEAHLGIGHTRWATHGAPTDANAHPHLDCRSRIAVVHNGIIENHQKLRKELAAKRHKFKSETDSEVLVHLIEEGLKKRAWKEAVRWALKRVTGTYSVVVLFKEEPGSLIAARSGGGGLAVGLGDGETFIASDAPALLAHTRKVFYLEENEMALVSPARRETWGISDGKAREKRPTRLPWTAGQAEKGSYSHFMVKEILEQPRALKDTLAGRLDPETGEVGLEDFAHPEEMKKFKRAVLLGCGTSYYAALVGKFLLEEHLRVPVEVDYASEFRYRKPVVAKGNLAVVLSQSGETVDTLVALREARARGAKVVAITNVVGSSVDREADAVLPTRAGPEIGVASTKAFLTQLACLWLLALHLARVRGSLAPRELKRRGLELAGLPALASAALKQRQAVASVARKFFRYKHFLYLGRGIQYPIALEGALKLKEISYIHAEGYPGGEMKHGPIALIDPKMPVVAIALKSSGVYEKVLNHFEEVKARGGKLIAVVEKGDRRAAKRADAVLEVPRVREGFSPLLTAIPLQLLAYEIARLNGREIDQPRNLAKSVTVE